MPSTTGSKQANREFRHQDATPVPRGRGKRPSAADDRADDRAEGTAAAGRSQRAETRKEGQRRQGGGQDGQGREQAGDQDGSEAGQGAVRRPEHSRRDPSARKTSKPAVNLRRTSETAPLRTAMDSISECFAYCLEEGHTEKEHLVAMLDAWDLLNAASSLVARGSGHADGLRQVCAEAVKACEESCEGFGDDQTMAACADVCREAYEHLVA